MLTKTQVQDFLTANQVTATDAQAVADTINVFDGCLSEHYDTDTAKLIGLWAALLMVLGQQQTVTSESTPVGASRSYSSGSAARRWDAVSSILRMLDTHGCIPASINPLRETGGGMWIGSAT